MKDFVTPWDHRMCFELALGIDATQDILDSYNVDIRTYEQWLNIPAFQKQLEDYRSYIREEGLSFREKARIQAEDMLSTSYTLVHHPDVPPHVKADLIKWTAKMADLEPAAKISASALQGTAGPLIDAAAIQQITDGELEIQVARIVKRRKQAEGELIEHSN